MARRVADLTIPNDPMFPRDAGKTYRITEMPARVGEEWANKLFFALANSGVQVPDDVKGAGLQGVAALGFSALQSIKYADIEPILIEMMACVSIKPNKKDHNFVRELDEDQDIEDIATRFYLRKAIFEMHTSFLQAGRSLTTLASPILASGSNSEITNTSQGPSES